MMKCGPLLLHPHMLRVLLCPGSWELLEHSCAGNTQQIIELKCSLGLHNTMWQQFTCAVCGKGCKYSGEVWLSRYYLHFA